MFSLAKKRKNSLVDIGKSNIFTFPKGYTGCLLIFVVLSAFRWDVGVDHLSYLLSYGDMMAGTYQDREGIEFGFLYISKLLASLGIHYTIYFALWAFLQIFFVVKAFESDKRVLPFVLLLIPIGGYYFTWMNGIRQMLVACSFLWAIHFILKKQPLYYFSWIAVGYLFHHSALILLPFYGFAYLNKVWNKKYISLVILAACVILGSTPKWINFLMNFSHFLDFIGYDRYAERLDVWTDEDSLRELVWGPRKIAVLATYIIVIWKYDKVRKYYEKSKIDLCYKLFFIGACLYYILVNTNHIFLRPLLYFTIFALPMTAYTLHYFQVCCQKYYFRLLLILSLSYTFFACWGEFGKSFFERKSVLYQFCFDHWDGVVTLFR